MNKLFEIGESEKKRILEMHENATKKNYLSEQGTAQPAQPTQRAAFHNILNDDGSQSQLKTSLAKIQNMKNFSQFNANKPTPTEVLDYLNSTGIPMYYAKKTTPDQKPITLIPVKNVDNAIITETGRRLNELLNLISTYLVIDVCGQEKSNCTGTFNFQQVRKAIDAISTKKADVAPELGGKIPSHERAIETINMLNKAQEYVPAGQSYDSLLKNISFTGFINASVSILNNIYSKI